jgi:hypothetical protein
MSQTTKITDHVVRGESFLTADKRLQATTKALLAAITGRVQELENAIFEVIVSRYLENAAGQALDFLGRLVGELRQSRSDDLYRLWIRVRVRINRSLGRPEDVIAVVRLIYPLADPFEYREYSPASFVVAIFNVTFPSDTARAIGQTKSIGTRGDLHTSTWAETDRPNWKYGSIYGPTSGKAIYGSVYGGFDQDEVGHYITALRARP